MHVTCITWLNIAYEAKFRSENFLETLPHVFSICTHYMLRNAQSEPGSPVIAPAGFWPLGQNYRGGTLEAPACIHIMNFKNVKM